MSPRRRQVTTRVHPAPHDQRVEFFAPVPGGSVWTSGARAESAPPPEEQLDAPEPEIDEDGLDAVDLMERGGQR